MRVMESAALLAGGAVVLAVSVGCADPSSTPGSGNSSRSGASTVATTPPNLPQSLGQNLEGPYPVTRVVDGDTFDVLAQGQTVRVRVVGINTPETVDPRRPVQCFGPEASVEAKRLLAGKSVWLESDTGQSRVDAFGRRLAFVWVDQRVDFGLTMIRDGFAREYTYKLPHRYQATYRDAERLARQHQRGLWVDGACAEQSVR